MEPTVNYYRAATPELPMHVTYRVYGGHRFFDYAEVKDMLAYLWVLQNPDDTLRLKRIINTPSRKIGEKLIEKAEMIAESNNLTLFPVD